MFSPCFHLTLKLVQIVRVNFPMIKFLRILEIQMGVAMAKSVGAKLYLFYTLYIMLHYLF